MPAFHLLRCMVAVGGDQGSQVYRHRGNPIAFPELPILQFLHGEEAISDIAVVGAWEAPNDEVLQRLQLIYSPEVVKEVFPGARPRLPLSDSSIPRCTRPVYKPRPTEPDSPEPKLRPLDQFSFASDDALDAPPLPKDTEPTPDEIAAHAQEDDEGDLGLGPDPGPAPAMPRVEDQPRIVRDTLGRGSIPRKTAERNRTTLPDVNAGGSHSPTHGR